MDARIRAASTNPRKPRGLAAQRRLVPMQVGGATVFIEQFGEPVVVEAEGQIRTVSPASPEEAFEAGRDILRECVNIIGAGIEAIAEKARPHKVAVEFSISFEVKGRASIIPVFLTGQAAGKTGLKVTAEWTRTDAKPG